MTENNISRRTLLASVSAAGISAMALKSGLADEPEEQKGNQPTDNAIREERLQQIEHLEATAKERLKSILDQELREELKKKLRNNKLSVPFKTNVRPQDVQSLIENVDDSASELPPAASRDAETIVRLFGRPVLLVQNDTFQTSGLESDVLRQRLERSRRAIEATIPSIGRIEVVNHPTHSWLGTGWLIAEDIIATNRHVANEFARQQSDGFTFRSNGARRMRAAIDFREEFGLLTAENEFAVLDILHIEEDGPDVAFLRIARGSRTGGPSLGQPIRLAQQLPQSTTSVAVIGYPAYDSRIPDSDLMERIYGGIYDVKRLAPGLVMAANENEVTHDCTTLGGNSGSAVLDMNTGEAVGIHFAGTYRTANYAVPCSLIAERLSRFT